MCHISYGGSIEGSDPTGLIIMNFQSTGFAFYGGCSGCYSVPQELGMEVTVQSLEHLVIISVKLPFIKLGEKWRPQFTSLWHWMRPGFLASSTLWSPICRFFCLYDRVLTFFCAFPVMPLHRKLSLVQL